MSPPYYSDPDVVIEEASLEPADLNEATAFDLRARIERYLDGIKALFDEYTGRDFHAEYGVQNPDGTWDYSGIPQAIHFAAMLAGVNVAQAAEARVSAPYPTGDEYQEVVNRDAIFTDQVRMYLDLLSKNKTPRMAGGGTKFSVFRVRSPRERAEDTAAGRLR